MTFNFDTNWLSGGDYGAVGNAINDYAGGGSGADVSPISDAINGYSDGGSAGFNLGSLPWDKIINTAGKLGSGIGGFLASRQAGQMRDYIPTTQWLGNGLARTGYVSNAANKQNYLDQAAGATNALSSLFGKGFGIFGRGFGDTNNSSDDYNSTYWDDYRYNPTGLSTVGYEIDRQANPSYDYGNIAY